MVRNAISLETNQFCQKFSILFFLTSTILSILYVTSSRAAPELILNNFSLSTCIPNGFSYSCYKIFVTCNTFSSDILICFGLIDLYSVINSSSTVSLWSSLKDVEASDLSRKKFLRDMIL